jgi:hypothetical protein
VVYKGEKREKAWEKKWKPEFENGITDYQFYFIYLFIFVFQGQIGFPCHFHETSGSLPGRRSPYRLTCWAC